MLKILILIVYLLTSSLGMVLIKKGGIDVKASILNDKMDISITWIFLIGVILFVMSFFLWIYVLQFFSLTYISPVAYGLAYILITFFSIVFLGEKFNIKLFLSGVIILFGIILATIGNKG